MPMMDKQLLAIVDAEFSSAMGAPGGEISEERAKAWDYYLSKPLGNEVEGQSQVVSSDVAETVDSIMPSLLRMFTTAENLVSFDAVGVEDEPQSTQESDYVNYVFFKRNPAFTILYNWFFDALVQKNGIVKAWWDDSEKISTENYVGLTERQLFDLLDDEELEPISKRERTEEVATESGTEEQPVFDVEFRRVSTKGYPRADNVPPEEYRISSDARSVDPSEARMVGQERLIKRSDLIDMGFEKAIVDGLSAHLGVNDSSEGISRYDKSDEDREGAHDRSQDMIKVREAYIKIDFDEDGRSELRQVFCAGRILSNEAVDRQPFHVICPKPLPHKHFGRAKSEDVMDIQQVTTTLQRQILDNLYHVNNPEHNVWEQALGENTLDNLLSRQAGSVNVFDRPPAESIATHQVPFAAGQTFPMLEFYAKKMRDRTGVSADSEGLSPDALKNIQTTVLSQALDQSKAKIEAVARVFAETGLKTLFLHFHEIIMKHQTSAETVKLRNQWVEVNPSSWRTRFDMTVNIGLGVGSREQNLLHLNNIWNKQKQTIEAGGMNLLVTPDNLYNAASEMVKNANLKQPDLYFTNPEGKEAPPQSEQQLQLKQQQIKLAERQQQLDAREFQLDQAKAQNQHQRELSELERKREKDQADIQLKFEELQQRTKEQEDKVFIELEKIANALTQMELSNNTDVPGSRV